MNNLTKMFQKLRKELTFLGNRLTNFGVFNQTGKNEVFIGHRRIYGHWLWNC